jgi:hypothetical protein
VVRALVAAILLVSGSVRAQRFDSFATMTTSKGLVAPHSIGGDYVAMTDLGCATDDCAAEVLNVRTRVVSEIHANGPDLRRRFAASDAVLVPRGSLVSYDGARAGFLFVDSLGADHDQWFAELDAHTGAVLRQTRLARRKSFDEVKVIGTHAGRVYFGIQTFDADRLAALHYAHEHSPGSFVVRVLDLATLQISDVATVALPARAQVAPLEDELYFQHSQDYSQIAIFEYWESVRPLTPEGRGYIVDTTTGTSFAFAIPPVVYAAAFAPDDRFLYFSSNETGAVGRVNLTERRVDLLVHGPKHTGTAVITPDGSHLALLASPAKTYVTFALPALVAAREHKLPAALVPVFELMSQTAVSDDGTQLLVEDPFGDPQPWHLIRIGP